MEKTDTSQSPFGFSEGTKTLEKYNETLVPFGACRGWPLSAVLAKRPEEYRRLRRMWKAGKLYGAIADGVAALEKTAAAHAVGEPGPSVARHGNRKSAEDRAWLAWALR